MKPRAKWVIPLIIISWESLVMALDIPLKCDRGGYVGDSAIPLGCGIPLKEGQAKSTEDLAIKATGKGLVPAQFEARTRYPDGSIQWLWADFQGPVENSYRLVIGRNKKTLDGAGMQVHHDGGKVVVRNGLMQVTWDTRYATPVKAQLASTKGVMQEVAKGRGDGVYVIDNLDKRAALGGPAAELDFKVETQNKLRTVIRIEGWYVREDGEKVARGVVRYHLYWRQPWIRMEHSLIITRDNDEVWFKEVGIRFPLEASDKAEALFGVGGGKSERVRCDEAGGEAYIFQSSYPIYYRKGPEYVLGVGGKVASTGKEAEGWADLTNGRAGLLVAVRDFAPQFPKELTADANGVTAKLWSGRDGRILDYRPATLVKDWWGEWADQAEKMNPKDIGRTKPVSVEELKSLNPSCVGVARTHEILFYYYLGATDEQRSRKYFRQFQTPPIVYPDPAWTCHADPRTFWQMAAKGELRGKYADLEDFITRWFDEFMVPLQIFPQTGWYDWMKPPYIRYFKEPTQDNRVYAQWWRVGLDDLYMTTKSLMIGWARSGDRRILEACQRFNRWQMDVKIIHWGGGKDQKKVGYLAGGSGHLLPSWWSGSGRLFTGYDTEWTTGPALEYLLCDARWNKDSLELAKQALLRDFSPEPRVLTESPDMSLSHMIGIYRILPDESLKKLIRLAFDTFTDVTSPIGMKESYWKPFGGHYTADYKLNRKGLAVAEYAEIFGGEEAKKIAAKAALASFGYKNTWHVCYYCEFYGASNAMAYRWNNNPEHLKAAEHQITGIQKLFAAYRLLPPEKTLTSHFINTIYTRCGSMSGGSYTFPDIPDKAGQPSILSFGLPTTGVAYVSVPIAAWTLQEQSRPMRFR